MEVVDVLIVGGGPAGLATAERTAPHGKTIVLHRDKEIGLPVRTSGGSWLKEVKRLGIPPSLYHEIRSGTFAGPTLAAEFAFGRDRPVILDVTGTYRHLADLAERAGAEIRRGALFTAVTEVAPEYVLCSYSHEGRERRIRARFVVDGSGYCRSVLTSLGISSKPNRVGVGAEYEFDNLSENRTHLLLFVGSRFAPSGYGWAFPTNTGTIRVGIGVLRPDTRAVAGPLLDEFTTSSEAKALGLRLGREVERHVGLVPADGAFSKLVYNRVVAVGDSASQALPNVGEGIRFCIDSGRHAGAGLALALQRNSRNHRELLAYERWWSFRHGRRFASAQALNRRLGTYSDAQWDRSVAKLRELDGDMMATFLRMDVSPKLAARLLWLKVRQIRRAHG